MNTSIGFNKPYMTGNETEYIRQSVESKKISGDGIFTKRCHQFLERNYNFKKCLLTTSCTDALEMAALLIDLKEGDEVIMPSYTFVSTSNAFVLRGAKIVFVDSENNTGCTTVSSGPHAVERAVSTPSGPDIDVANLYEL